RRLILAAGELKCCGLYQTLSDKLIGLQQHFCAYCLISDFQFSPHRFKLVALLNNDQPLFVPRTMIASIFFTSLKGILHLEQTASSPLILCFMESRCKLRKLF